MFSLEDRIEKCAHGALESLTEMQRHRDHWREYAYGRRDKPQDFLDGNKVDRLPTRIEKLAALLEELDEYFDDEVDVVDGPDGQPRPNDAMRWQQRIREALGKSLIP